MTNKSLNYQTALGDDESLKKFLETVAKFDREFCDNIVEGTDFTLRLEVRGDKGKMLHARINSDSFRRPRNAEGNAECS